MPDPESVMAKANAGKSGGGGMNPWIAGAGIGLDALGKLLGGGAQEKLAKEQSKLNRDQFNWSQMGDAVNAQRTLDADKYGRTNTNYLVPARQQVLQALASRLGLGNLQYGDQQGAGQARNPLGEQLGRAWQGSEDPNKRGFAAPGGYVQTGVDPAQAAASDAKRRVQAEIDDAKRRMNPVEFGRWMQANMPRLRAALGG